MFRLTKFISNNENVMKTIPDTEKAKLFQCATFNSDLKGRAFDIKWDVNKDFFKF